MSIKDRLFKLLITSTLVLREGLGVIMKRAVALYCGTVKKDTIRDDAVAINAVKRIIHHPLCNIFR